MWWGIRKGPDGRSGWGFTRPGWMSGTGGRSVGRRGGVRGVKGTAERLAVQRLESRHALAVGFPATSEPAMAAASAVAEAVNSATAIPFTYELDTSDSPVQGITITGYTGANAGETVTVPATIAGKPVIGIGSGAFTDVRSGRICLPGSIWPGRIMADAFGNEALAAIDVLPVSGGQSWYALSIDGVLCQRIPDFSGERGIVTLLRVPAGRPGISYVVPAGVHQFDPDAFLNCRFESITLGPDVRFLGDSGVLGGFRLGSCRNLASYAVDPANTAFAAVDGNLYTKDRRTLLAVAPAQRRVVIPFGVTVIGTDYRHPLAPEADPFAACAEHERFLSGQYSAFRSDFPASVQQIALLQNLPSSATLVFAGDAPLVDNGARFENVVGNETLVIRRGDAFGWPEGDLFHGHRLIRSSVEWNWIVPVTDAPANVQVESGAGRVRLSWEAPEPNPEAGRIEDYAVRFSRDDGATWVDVVRPASIATTAVIQDLDVGVPYVFAVAAVNQLGRGPFSIPDSAVVLAADPPESGAMRAPTGVAARSAGAGAATVSWRAVSAGGVLGYEVRWSSDGGWTWSQPTRTTGGATSATVRGLMDGVAHLFQVAAYGKSVVGERSRPSPAAVAVPGANAERPGNRGRSDMQYSPDGRLARLTWQAGLGLVYRIEGRQPDLQEEVVLVREAVPPGGVPDAECLAQLLLAADGTPQVVVAIGEQVLHYKRDAGGWRLAGTVLNTDGSRITQLSATIDGAGAVHVIATDRVSKLSKNGFIHGSLIYATNRGGTWRDEDIASGVGAAVFYDTGVYIRYLDIAVDARGFAHIVFTPKFDVIDYRSPDGRYWTRDYSEMAYLTNASGEWVRTIVHRPPDGTGASGFGASIAIAPGGQPAIAHFFMDNVATGSAVSAKLLYSVRRANGTWATSVVATRPDGYALGDGPNFTGFAPQLAFDRQGVAHIAFSDYAAEHPRLSAIGQVHRAGQLRHAWLTPAGWATETILRSPQTGVLAYPSLAVRNGQFIFSGVTRDTSGNISLSTSIVDRPPPPPEGVTVQRGAGSVILSWSAMAGRNAGLPVTGYVVQSSRDGGRTWGTAARVAGNTATIKGLTNGRAYVFRVAGVNDAGTGRFTAKSSEIVPATVPGAVRMLTAKRRAGSADLRWTAPGSNGGLAVTDYRIEWSEDAGTTWKSFARAASVASSARLVAASIGPATRFRVAAVNGVGVGGFASV